MGFLKPKSDYCSPPDANFKPGPKNGHLTGGHLAMETMFMPVEAQMAPLWDADMPLDDLKKVFSSAPPQIPEGCPQPGKDLTITYNKVTVRDGGVVELKIWKSIKPQLNAALVLRMHGGGWTVGSHEMEESENLYLGALPNVVVVSVDYRM